MGRAFIVSVVVGITVVVAGCGADMLRLTSATYPPHANRVFLTKADLPAAVIEPLADLQISKGSGSTDNTQQALADRARELGADAVIHVKSGRVASTFPWASPYSSGRAVKIRGDAKEVLRGVAGEWR